MFKEKQLTIGRTFAYFYIFVQGLFSLLWMCFNLTAYSPEKLSNDYILAAKTFIVDDYMGILYAVFLAPIVAITDDASVIHSVVAIIQTVAVFASFIYFVKTYAGGKLSETDKVLVALCGTTVPFVLQASFSVLPNSFCLCAVLVFASVIYRLAVTPSAGYAILLSVISLLTVLLSGDYAFLLILIIIPALVSELKRKNTTALLAMGSAVVVLIITHFVTDLWVVYESYGRVTRSLGLYAYQRCSWPYIFENKNALDAHFGYFNDSGNAAAVSVSEKIYSDYFMAYKNANPEAYNESVLWSLSKSSFLYRSKSVIFDTLKDALGYTFPSLAMTIFYLKKTSVSILPALLARFFREAPNISRKYMSLFVVGSIITVVLAALKTGFGEVIKKHLRTVLFVLYVIIILALYSAFFSVRGFDYRNSIFAASVPMILCIAFLLRRESDKV